MSKCSLEFCDHKSWARGFCPGHYDRFRRNGTPGNTPIRSRRTMRPPGLSKEDCLHYISWDVTDAGCWIWKGAKEQDGYGVLSWEGSTPKVHRLAYETWVGPIPEGHMVRHKCDNRPCMNPDHLDTGTHADNMRDMANRGRAARRRGVDTPSARLTEFDIPNIRHRLSQGESQSDIARDFRVSKSTISDINTKKSWSWVA